MMTATGSLRILTDGLPSTTRPGSKEAIESGVRAAAEIHERAAATA